jgi:hypothetical protein
VFGAIVEIAVLPMSHAGQHLAFSRPIAGQFIGNNDAGHVGERFEELPKEFLRSRLVPPALHQDVEHVPVLVDGAP